MATASMTPLAGEPAIGFGQPIGQGWEQIGHLGLALVLSALIGLERETKQKSAGLRTHTLVGVGAALFMLISKFGFTDVLAGSDVMLDPSRLAAQVVTGIGFIGGGLIFVRRDAVRGLTTAAVVWVTTAVGMAAGAGLWVLALIVTGSHFLVVYGLTPAVRRLDRSQPVSLQLRLTLRDTAGTLRRALSECTRRGLTVVEISSERHGEREYPPEIGRDDRHDRDTGEPAYRLPAVSVVVQLQGARELADLAAALTELDGVLGVSVGESDGA